MTTNPGPCAIVPTDNLKPEVLDRLEAIIAGRRATPGNLLPVLHEAQEIMGYVPAPMQAAIAAGLNLPGSDIFGTMSFYSMFAWKPRGKYIVRMCQSPPCHVNGAENMLQALQAELGLAVGQTTADGLFTLELSACLGICEVAPAMQINEVVHGNLTREKIGQIIADYRAGKAPDFRQLPYSTKDYRHYKHCPAEPVLMDNVGLIDPMEIQAYLDRGGYGALKKALTTMTPEAVVEEVKTSGLRGRGGAGFPAGLKWSFTRPLTVTPKYIVCNADEGEPGTIKDRYLMEGDPHKVLEGMAIAGYAVGASRGFIYCRGEYYLSQHRLQHAINQATAQGFLGEKLFGTDFSFNVEIRSGGGCYICGEETALIESVEGKRGYPRLKPPFPGVSGLWGRPTVVNNVETLSSVPAIINRGGAWYKSLGTPDTSGTKIYQVIGHVQTPQIVEAPVGLTLRELIDTYGGGLRPGRSFKMCQTGGASAGLVTAESLDVPMDFGSLAEAGGALGSGTMLVMDESTCVLDFLRAVAVFFAHESCGQCTPCREGTLRLLQTITRIYQGRGKMEDLAFLERLAATLQDASYCPLGQSAGVPLMSALKHFRPEIEAHIQEKKCRAGACQAHPS
ncbi:MAG: NADH-quinone oxidoreductase subunit NuoF [Deltaproteobacteria bacterium]|nr:NADH-quinone oxidoreductase subunit NuoF [Deltaproteobacteria bacterium]